MPKQHNKFGKFASVAAALASGGGCHFALAQGVASAANSPLYITLGGYGILAPEYDGARHSTWAPRPIFGWRRENEKEWLPLPRDSFDIALVETDKFRAGPIGAFRFSRSEDAAPRGTRRIWKVDTSVEAGGYAEFWPVEWLRTRAEVRHAVIGGDGLVADLSADVVLRPVAPMTIAFGPRLSIANSDYLRSAFGISPAQAAATGLPVYTPGGGIRAYGAGLFGKYALTREITGYGFVEYERLTGDAAESPVVNSRTGSPDQTTIGLGLSYTFKAPW